VVIHVPLGLLLVLSASAVDAATDTQTRTVALPAGRGLSLEITVGEVRIEGSARADAVIEITRRTPTADGLARVPVEIVEEEADVRIRGVQIEGGTDPAYRTDVILRVPSTALLKSIRIVEGRLVLSGLENSVTADVRRGPIEAVNLRGSVRLETGIGHIVADRMTLSPDGVLRLRAFNGDVRLTLAERPLNARILALALNGTISSDIPLRMKDTWGPRWGEATIGKGEPVISIDIISGKIEIRSK
jgi:hypothetical protein